MNIVFATIVPHPPIIIPEIGKGEEKTVQSTIDAYKTAMQELKDSDPDTVVIISPHSVMYSDYFHISPGRKAQGNFMNFGQPSISVTINYDTDFANALSFSAEKNNFPAGTLGARDPFLDHGTLVPIYFLKDAYGSEDLPPIVRISLSGLSLVDHYNFGMLLQKTAKKLNRKTAIIGSGDLSHKLKTNGPYGYIEEGPKYDERVMEIMEQAQFEELLDFSPEFLERAAECGHRSFTIMAGALNGLSVQPEFLSYQDTLGVGYGICTYRVNGTDPDRCFLDSYKSKQDKKDTDFKKKHSIPVCLARTAVEQFIKIGKIISAPDILPDELKNNRAGVFVTLHKNGELRGCIGTIAPVRDNIAEEIISNAISASIQDTRFKRVSSHELSEIEYSVDILGKPENIDSKDELDITKYGVIATSGTKRGLLLPNLDGISSIDEQVSIALKKANILDDENYTLQRFEVVRYY